MAGGEGVLEEVVGVPGVGPRLGRERGVLARVGTLGKVPGDQVGRLPPVPGEGGEMAGVAGEQALVMVLAARPQAEGELVEGLRLEER